MSIDTTTAELFVWIVLTVFLIVIPVFLLFKQQLPYVLNVIDNLKNIGLSPLNSKIKSVRDHLSRPKKSAHHEEITEETDTLSLDPFEQESHDDEMEIVVTERELDTGEKGLIDIDAIQDQPDSTSDELTDKQQQDLESIKYAALSHKERGKLDLYEKKLIEWLAIAPDNGDLLKLLWDYYFESGNMVKALTILKKIINEDWENHKAIRQIAQIYLHQNQHETAQLLVEKAIQLKPDNPKYHITMVEIFYANKQHKLAIKSMENVLKLRPTNKNYMLTLAWLHEEIGEPTKAKSYYSKILQIDPSNEVAKRSLKRLSFK